MHPGNLSGGTAIRRAQKQNASTTARMVECSWRTAGVTTTTTVMMMMMVVMMQGELIESVRGRGAAVFVFAATALMKSCEDSYLLAGQLQKTTAATLRRSWRRPANDDRITTQDCHVSW
jgi:cytochrome b561